MNCAKKTIDDFANSYFISHFKWFI